MAKMNGKQDEPMAAEDQAAKEVVAQAAAAKVDVLKDCPQRGHGGRYVFDVKTGMRTRVVDVKKELNNVD